MKIFLVVGTLFPFERLVKEVDQWTASRKDIKVVGQIGNSKYKPAHIEHYKMLNAKDFNEIFEKSDLVITHAGMGIILKSLMSGKPIVVLPRKIELKEHTTDHQVATAKALDKMNYIHIAWDNNELLKMLEYPERIPSRVDISEFASTPLINGIRNFIEKA